MEPGETDSEFQTDFGEAVGRPFEEKLLLSLIDAHPEANDATYSPEKKSERREARLRDALKALFATEVETSRPQRNDLRALRWMGEQLYQDRAMQTMKDLGSPSARNFRKARSDRALSRLAAERFYPNTQAAERLRLKFRKEKKYWFEIAQTHDDVPETLEAQALGRIAEILRRQKVPMNPVTDE